MIKTPAEIAVMREGGQKLGKILQDLLEFSQVGITLVDIDSRADSLIKKAGGSASFKTVRGYKWATCLCVNEVVVHGVPTDYLLKTGDVFTIDVGLLYKGFHTDTAWTKIIGEKDDEFLRVGQMALEHAIALAKVGNRVGHISKSIEDSIKGGGFGIVKSLVGHGVGAMLHEEPQIPGFLRGGTEDSPQLEEGMTLAIEVIYAKESGKVSYDHPDGWTVVTTDRSVSAVFEHTIAITPNGPTVLTKVGN